MADQAEGLRALARRVRPHRLSVVRSASDPTVAGRVIAFAGGRAGVGVTTILANLGVLLARAGRRVLLLDGDAGVPNAHMLLGVRPSAHLGQVLRGDARPEDIASAAAPNLAIAACSLGEACMMPLAESVARQVLASMAARAEVVLVDTGHSSAALFRVLAGIPTDFVVVATPEPAAIADTYAALRLAARIHPYTPLSVLVNMATSQREAETVANRLSAVTSRFLHFRPRCLGCVPVDTVVTTSVGVRTPFVTSSADAAATRALARVAHQIAPLTPSAFVADSVRGRQARVVHAA